MPTFVRAFAFAAVVVATTLSPRPLAAQDAAAPDECSVELFAPSQLAQASILVQRAAAEPGTEASANHLRDAGRFLGDARRFTGNPSGYAFVQAQLFLLWLHQDPAPESMTPAELNFSRDRNTSIRLLPAVDSLFTSVETSLPECVPEIARWRQSKPWADRIGAVYRLLGEGNADGAAEMIKEVAVLDRNSPFLYNALAQIAAAREDLPEMLTQLDKAIQLAKLDEELVETERQMRTQYASVLQGYSAGLSDAAARDAGVLRAAQMFLDLGFEAPAAPDAPAYISAALDVAVMLQNDSLLEAAIAPMVADPEPYPDLALLVVGENARLTGRIEQAITLYQSALAKNPNVRDANYFLAYLLLEAKRYEETHALTDKLIELDPSNPDNYLMKSIAVRELAKAAPAQQRAAMNREADRLGQVETTMPHRVTVVAFERRVEGAMLEGTIENRGRAAKAYNIEVSFLNLGGEVVETLAASTESVAPNAAGEFQLAATQPGIVAWKYKAIE